MILIFFLLPFYFLIAPSVHWLDSTALACAACTLGVAHPPGQIPHTVIGELFSLIPFGDCSFRVALFSYLSVLFSAFFFFQWAKVKSFFWASLCVSVLFFYAAPVRLQAIRPEVYGFSILAFSLVLYFSSKQNDRRYQILSWFLWGIGMWNHPVIGLASLPWLSFERKYFWGFFLTLPIVVYLPIRSYMGAGWNFGSEPNFWGLIWYLRAKLYPNYGGGSVLTYLYNSQGVMEIFLEIFTPIGLLFGMVGGYRLYKSEKIVIQKIFISLLLSLLPVVTRTSNFSSTNPDIAGYLLPSGLLILFLTFQGLIWSFRKFPKTTVGIYGAWLCIFGYSFFSKIELKNDFSGLYHLRQLSQEPKSFAFINLASFHTLSFLKYTQVVEGVRPDLTLSYRGLSIERQGFVDRVHLQGVERRPAYWELAMDWKGDGEFTLKLEDRDLSKHLKPEGWFYSFGQRGSGVDPLKDYSAHILKTCQMATNLQYAFLEPLLFNQVNHFLFALHQEGGTNRAEEIRKSIMQTFPDFHSFDELR